jgi:hypothetical protein
MIPFGNNIVVLQDAKRFDEKQKYVQQPLKDYTACTKQEHSGATTTHMRPSIEESRVFHIYNRRINFDTLPSRDYSINIQTPYSMLRAWVQDDLSM